MNMRLPFYIAAVYGTAAFTGAMLTIGLVLGAYWKSLPPAEFLDWFAENSNLVARMIPLFVLPALAGLIGGAIRQAFASIEALASFPGRHDRDFGHHICVHLPMNAEFNAKSVSLADVDPMLDRWLWLHTVRIVLGLATSILSVMAIHAGAKRAAIDPTISRGVTPFEKGV